MPMWVLWDPIKPCTCARSTVTKYQKRISAPLLDRIDIHVEVPRVGYQKLSDDRLGEPSESIRQRVEAARDIQRRRFAATKTCSLVCNADMRVAKIRQFCKLDGVGETLVRAALGQMNLSARGYRRVHGSDSAGVRYRAIADLAGCENIQAAHLAALTVRFAKALQYRPKMM